MEEHNKLDYDSDVIICEDIPETISVSTSPETLKKLKKKKCKRKVKRGVNINNNMETLLITQKLKVKKTKFNCVININTVCEKSLDSIVRHHTNVCNKKAYYHRIVPVCMREVCSGDSSCCRSTMSRDYNKYLNSKAGSLSPVSSIPLTDVFSCTNISYEDVTNGSFSSASEGELDTLIKRTRQREKQIDNLDARKHTTSTPMSIGIASPFSIDDKKSIHSDNTMILNALPIKTYSPSLDVFRIDQENVEETNDMNDINVPYSPTMTPDLINDDNIPYSPTYTPETIEIEMDDLKRNLMDEPYSPTFTPDIIELENVDNEPYSSTMAPDKMENTNNYVDRANAIETNVGYSSRSTESPDFHKFTITPDNSNNNDLYSPIKQENLNESTINRNTVAPKFAILTPDLIKKENEMSHKNKEIDYNMSNAVDGASEKDDHQREHAHNPNEIIVKPEKGEDTSINYGNSMVFKNNVKIKTENGS